MSVIFLIRRICSFKIPFLHRDLLLRFDGVTLTGCCFFPDQQNTSGKLMCECHFPSFLQLSSDLHPHFSLVIGVFLPLGGLGPPGPGTPPPPPPRFDGVTLTGVFFTDQRITSGKLTHECHFSSFVLRFSDLSPHFSLVIWVFFFPGPGTARFDGVTLTGCFFSPDLQITSGKLMFACYFSSFVLLPSDLPPPSLARDLGFTDWLSFFPASANHEREIAV